MSTYYRHLIESGLLLDIYPNAAVAYSLRKLRDAYTGSAIRVRRVVDNTEQDIGFDSADNLDTTAIENFFGNNLLLQSENFANASWAKAQSVIVTDAITAPNGTDLADKLNETATNNVHTLTQGFGTNTLNNGSNYLFSVYLKAAERDVVDLVSGLAGSSQVLRINLTSGTVVSNGFSNSPTITNVGSGWWKLELIITSAVTSVPTGFQIRLTNGTTQSYLGVTGSGCYIWAAQVSGYTGSIVPYFKTTTIAASNVAIPVWYDQSGNGRNATQTSATIQGLIVRNGFVIKVNNKPSVLFSVSFYSISSSPGNLQGSNFAINVVNKTSATNLTTFGNTNTGGRPRFPIWDSTGDIGINTQFIGNDAGLGTRLITPYVNSGIGGAFVNGVALPNTATIDQTVSNCSTIGRSTSTGGSSGNYMEMVWWKQDLLTLRTSIEQNINEYYGIY